LAPPYKSEQCQEDVRAAQEQCGGRREEADQQGKRDVVLCLDAMEGVTFPGARFARAR
jgi:hypothetical protein